MHRHPDEEKRTTLAQRRVAIDASYALIMTTASPDTPAQSLRIINTAEFLAKARISKSTLCRLEKSDPSFPKPGQLATRGCRLWLESAVDAYLVAKLSTPAAPNTARVLKAVSKSVQERARGRGRAHGNGASPKSLAVRQATSA